MGVLEILVCIVFLGICKGALCSIKSLIFVLMMGIFLLTSTYAKVVRIIM
jgi:hypothetical protein